MPDEIKLKIGADGAASAATQLDKLVASLEKQRKTLELIGKTEINLKRQTVIDAIKKESDEVNKLETVYSRFKNAIAQNQQAQAANNNVSAQFLSNTSQLRAKLGPAAALVGNLSSSFSVLAPQTAGASAALQHAGMAAGQMLGVLGGGPGVLIGGLVAAIASLATYFATAKKEADDLAKSTDTNTQSMGSYLDKLAALRTAAKTTREQRENEDALRRRLYTTGKASTDEYEDEINVQRSHINQNSQTTYSPDRLSTLYQAGRRDDLLKAQAEQKRDAAKLNDLLDRQRAAQGSADAAEWNERAKKEGADAIVAANAGGTKSTAFDLGEANAPTARKGTPGYLASQQQLEKLSAMQAEYQKRDIQRELADERAAQEASFAQFQTAEKLKADMKQFDREQEAQANERARQEEEKAFSRHMQQLADQRKVYQDLATQGSNIMAGTAIKSFQMIAKGQKAEIGAILEGIGDQIVAMGTGYIFKGIAESILLNPQGPALIGVGTAAVGFGIGLGAAGARSQGGSSAGGAPAADNAFGPRDTESPSPLGTERGPTIININFPTVLSPSAADGQRVKRAVEQATRVYG